jgi:hypothetical protein
MAVIQREYKDRLFQFIFGREENKAWTLSLYNAVNGTAYTNPNLVQINTIKEVLYLGMHNDTSFLLTDDMNLYDQQSSYNPNMPLLMMQYAGNLYEKYIKENGLNKYGSELLKLPVPRLIVFYNGVKDTADETMLRLSDSFPEGPRPDIEVSVRLININHEQNKDLLDACEPLKEYSWLMQEIRSNRKIMEIEDAVDKALADMPKEFVIRSFLEAHKVEVSGMLLTEYNEAETMELFKQDGIKEGRREGIEQNRIESIKNIMESFKVTAQQAMEALKIPVADQAKYLAKL